MWHHVARHVPWFTLGNTRAAEWYKKYFLYFAHIIFTLGNTSFAKWHKKYFFLFCGKLLPTSKFIAISSFITKSSSSSKSSPRVRWGPKIINSENLLLTPRRPYLTWQSRKRVDSIKRTQSLQAIGHWKEQVIITRRTFCVFGSLILSEGQPIEMKPTYRIWIVW